MCVTGFTLYLTWKFDKTSTQVVCILLLKHGFFAVSYKYQTINLNNWDVLAMWQLYHFDNYLEHIFKCNHDKAHRKKSVFTPAIEKNGDVDIKQECKIPLARLHWEVKVL